MATNLEVEFPKQKGWYTLAELKYLANSLGFDSSVFTKVMFSEKKTLGSKDSTFNNKPAKDNVKTIKKVLQLLRHKVLGFPEITQARITYFLYENDDQLGMDADKFTILKALKLFDRVISPVRLDKYLIDMSLSVQIPCRLQLNEFLELVSLTVHIDDVAIRCEEDAESDFEAIQTRDQKALNTLDEEFKATQSLNETSKEKYTLPKEYSMVQNSEHESSVLLAQDQALELYTSVANSTTQLRSARSGHSVSRQGDCDSNSRTITSLSFDSLTKQLSHHQSLKFQFRKLPLRESRQSHRRSKSTDVSLLQGSENRHKPPNHDSSSKQLKSTTNNNVQLHSTTNSSNNGSGELGGTSSKLTRSQPSPLGYYSTTRDGKITPIITDEEITMHQYKIDDLQWDMLRKETANSKRRTLKSSVSAPHVHNLSQLKINSSRYLNPDVQVLSIFGELETEKLQHYHQKPRSFTRSKSVNFKL
ncbi:uncharacterized protein [Dysidea avara]|uniref:uncharacterized protein n=1 Tax=Dysidea avara TaxID=196820 RepID=UPI00331C9C43